MRISIICALLAIAACSKPNPDACCTTQQQCDTLGLDGITACKADNVCDPNGACVAKECSTSGDCASPDRPVCINQLCVAKCSVDDDCNGLLGTPHCGTDGVCVACVDATQCTADAPVCDVQGHACRGCTMDSECPGGVCLESSGMCAADASIVYVRADGSDSGMCTAAAPCLTLPFAFGKLNNTRNVVHIMGTSLTVGTGTVQLPNQQTLFLDGEDTMIRRDDQGAVFTSSALFVSTTLSRVTVGSPGAGNQSLAISSGTVVFAHAGIAAPLSMTGGSVEVAHGTLDVPMFDLTKNCSMNGTLDIHDSVLHGSLDVTDCTVTIARTAIDSLPKPISLDGTGVKVVENNTITSTDFNTDALGVAGDAGSTVRFNTFVNFSGVDTGAQVLTCGNGVVVTSNIFAWHSHTPLAGCTLQHNLFDDVLGLQPGTGNHVGDASTFFVDLTNKDLHLSANSPAKGIAETGLPVTTDLEGNPRPQPTGSMPDVGAYEAP
jgi:hypothetical protein